MSLGKALFVNPSTFLRVISQPSKQTLPISSGDAATAVSKLWVVGSQFASYPAIDSVVPCPTLPKGHASSLDIRPLVHTDIGTLHRKQRLAMIDEVPPLMVCIGVESDLLECDFSERAHVPPQKLMQLIWIDLHPPKCESIERNPMFAQDTIREGYRKLASGEPNRKPLDLACVGKELQQRLQISLVVLVPEKSRPQVDLEVEDGQILEQPSGISQKYRRCRGLGWIQRR